MTDEVPVIPQAKPTIFKGSVDLKSEEDLPDKRCIWIMERGTNIGLKCPNKVYNQNDTHCSKHKVIANNKAAKEQEKKVTFPGLASLPSSPREEEDFSFDLHAPEESLVKFNPPSNIPECLKNDQDIIDILRGLVMIRVKLAGITN